MDHPDPPAVGSEQGAGLPRDGGPGGRSHDSEPVGPVDAELRALLDHARADGAARERMRERWLRDQAREDATLAGALRDLAERASGVSLATTAGRVHHGVIAALGADYTTLRTAAGASVHVPLPAVASLRVHPGVRVPPASGARAGGRLRLAELLARCAADRPRVQLALHGAQQMLVGELETVGTDVCTVRADDGSRRYVNLGALSEVSFAIA